MNKSALLKGLILSVSLVLTCASVAAQPRLIAEAQSVVFTWPLVTFLSVIMIGAAAAIIWDIRSD
ncbi:MAG: hypothetical protein ACE37M_13890 [Henriciella sp.]